MLLSSSLLTTVGVICTASMPSTKLPAKTNHSQPAPEPAQLNSPNLDGAALEPRQQGFPGRVFSSTALILAFILAGLLFLVYGQYPWRRLAALDSSIWLVEWACQAPEYIYGKENRDLVILGSSLILAPSQRLHDMEARRKDSAHAEPIIPKGDIYKKELTKLTGSEPTVKVLAVPGAMVSDQLKIVQHLVREGKTPKLLVFTLAPRDFIANDVGDDPDFTPIGRVFHFSALDRNLGQDLLNSKNPLEAYAKAEEFGKAHLNFIDAVRRIYLRQAKDWSAAVTGHPVGLVAPVKQADSRATEAVEQSQSGSSNVVESELQKDLELYRSRYLPLNEKRLTRQLGYLDEMLKIAREANYEMVLVGMPLTEENIAILGQDVYSSMQGRIAAVARKYQVTLIEFNNYYQSQEFADSVHLNENGSRTFVKDFCQKVSASDAYTKVFNARH
ncbi:MAG: hypothetical protein K2Y32_04200 [Candidatus Obscuribacterales bacterium]|nr:hypothetical protein [Candidatus Obscuribacterales bacterium]